MFFASTDPIFDPVFDPVPGHPPTPSVIDDPDEWPGFGRLLDGSAGQRWESHVSVEGMRCASCALTLEAAIRRVPGIEQVEANAARGTARVIWTARLARPSAWFDAAAVSGYRLTPARGASPRVERLRSERRVLWRWLVATLCMMQVMMYAYPAYIADPGTLPSDLEHLLRWASWVLSLPVLVFACGPFFRQSARDLANGRIGMDLPIALGITITFGVSTLGTFEPAGRFGREVYFDSLTMFVFFLLSGRWLEARLSARSAASIERLLDALPQTVERWHDGTSGVGWVRVAVRRLRIGDRLRVLGGETFPADGLVLAGVALADESLLSGESTPVRHVSGEVVLAGSHNVGAAVEIRVTALGPDARLGQIEALIRNAAATKPRVALLADRLARPFLIAVLSAAAGVAAWHWADDPVHAVMMAVAVLIVTCPCALSLATPAALLAGAAALARQGVMVVRLPAIEALARVDTVIFDKTGTLTHATPRLVHVDCRDSMQADQALALAASIAEHSLHPFSRSLVVAHASTRQAANALGAPVSPLGGLVGQVSAANEISGAGIEARWCPDEAPGTTSTPTVTPAARSRAPPSSRVLRLGSRSFCAALHCSGEPGSAPGPSSPASDDGACCQLADANGPIATFHFEEDLRDDARATVERLRELGLTVRLLSGDRHSAVHLLAARAGIDQVTGDTDPSGKLRALQALHDRGARVLMVGDGLNDAPVLAHADVAFAMSQAVPLAQANADFVVLNDKLMVIADTIGAAHRVRRVVAQNLAWALAYNAAMVPLAVLGWLPAWLAGLGMALSSVVVIGNAARLSTGRHP